MRAALLVCFTTSVCLAQQWELGGAAGFGWYRDASVTTPSASARTGIDSRIAAGMVLGDDMYRHLGGEFRYTFLDGDLRLKSNGQLATMEGQSHAFHYDLLIHATPRGSRVRVFAAAGGGGKEYRAIGRESAFQPLSNFVLLTKTHQIEPMISFGGGVKAKLSRHSLVRFDFRDYATPVPDHLLTPARGAKIHGWLHDFVPLVGVSYIF